MRSQFTFYKSFDDVYQDLNNVQKLEYMKVILDVQFLRIKVEDVSFSDKELKSIWNAQKHTITTSIKGYLDSQRKNNAKEPFFGCYNPKYTPLEGGTEHPLEGGIQQVKDKDKDKGKVKDKNKEEILEVVNSSNGLNKESFIEWLEYKKFKYQINSINKLIEMLTQYDFYIQKEIIDNSIMNNYKGLFEPKKKTSSSMSLYDKNKQHMEDFMRRINQQEILDGEVI